MLGKNIAYYRLKKGLSKKELAERMGLSPMAISLYESNQRTPSPEILKRMSDVLEIPSSYLCQRRNANLFFVHGAFRKSASFGKEKQDFVKASVEEQADRLLTIMDILGINGPAKQWPSLSFSLDPNEDALSLRKALGFASSGPIPRLVEALEEREIFYFPVNGGEGYSGSSGTVNNTPYVAVNAAFPAERIRSTIAHELVHLLFKASEEEESKVNAVACAFLFPKEDAFRELGYRRKAIGPDMLEVAKKYGITMLLLVRNARDFGILPTYLAKQFFAQAIAAGWKENEPSRYPEEKACLFENLVFRALSEEEITISRGAELLKAPYSDVFQKATGLIVE